MKFDLHCHSIHSDGSLTPEDLLSLAREREITHLALTDHDTLDGLEAAGVAAAKQGLELINGLELSASWRGRLVHVVGLDVDPGNDELCTGVAANKARRLQRAGAMIEDFRRHDIELEDELLGLLDGAVPTRPHFAQALINLGLVKDKKQAFKRYLVRGKPGFVPMQWPELDEIGSWIGAAGGVGVLAHPLRYGLTRTKLLMLVADMQDAGIHGIEVSTPIHDGPQREMLADIALQHNLLASIGSDFHSHDQAWAKLGAAWPLPDRVTPVWSQFSSAA